MGATILIYGNTKVGKTLDACHTFKKGIVLLAEPDGLASVVSNLGYEPKHIPLTNLDEPEVELVQAVETVRPMMMDGRCSCVILDTGTELGNRLLSSFRRRFPKNGFGAFGFVQDTIQDLIRRLQTTPAAFVMLCHESSPTIKDGIKYLGGPLLPSKPLTQTVPTMFSVLLRARIHDRFGRVYECTKDPCDWQMGDRYGATANLQPLDLRPIMFRIMFPGQDVPEFPPKNIRIVPEPFADLMAEEELEKGTTITL